VKTDFRAELAAALVNAQGISCTPESAAEDAKFAASVLERASAAFARLEFESEPAGFAAAQRRTAP
jgi:hypothetical protein